MSVTATHITHASRPSMDTRGKDGMSVGNYCPPALPSASSKDRQRYIIGQGDAAVTGGRVFFSFPLLYTKYWRRKNIKVWIKVHEDLPVLVL